MTRLLLIAAAALAATTASAALRTSLAPLGRAATDGLPAGYTRCEYLQNNGYARIAVNFTATTNVWRFVSQFSCDTNNVRHLLLGNYPASSNTNIEPHNNGYIRHFAGGDIYYTTNKYEASSTQIVVNNIEMAANGKNKAWTVLNGVTTESKSIWPTKYAQGMYLFCDQRGNSVGATRIHMFKLYDASDTLVVDYIPALDRDGVPCMYDRVTKQPFYNQGTGTFLYKIKE